MLLALSRCVVLLDPTTASRILAGCQARQPPSAEQQQQQWMVTGGCANIEGKCQVCAETTRSIHPYAPMFNFALKSYFLLLFCTPKLLLLLHSSNSDRRLSSSFLAGWLLLLLAGGSCRTSMQQAGEDELEQMRLVSPQTRMWRVANKHQQQKSSSIIIVRLIIQVSRSSHTLGVTAVVVAVSESASSCQRFVGHGLSRSRNILQLRAN